MDVILLERIERLGQMGDEVRVKPGFARNFLVPKRKALRATAENRRYFETKRADLEARNLERRSEAEQVSAKADGRAVVLVRQAGEAGHLYGSVTPRDIAQALSDDGIKVEKSQIRLNAPIKALGVYKIRVDLHPEVAIHVTCNVARSPEEAEVQARTGKAVVQATDQGAETAEEAAPAAAEPAAEGEPAAPAAG